MKNQQGDVVQILSVWGTKLVEYSYDAWGNYSVVYSHSSYGDLAEINPIRYRGYYYDFETGFYYLQSRYYDPSIHRFINTDAYVSTGQGFIGCNMFVHCLNNPIMRIDIGGYISYTFMNLDDSDDEYEGITAMGGGGGFGSNVYYDSTAYGTYTIRSINTTYDANLGGYYYGGLSSSVINPNYYIVPSAQTVGEESAIPIVNVKHSQLYGSPGEIHVGKNKETRIGYAGKADLERHWTNHGSPKIHSIPHDHRITWDIKGNPNFSHAINYWDGFYPPLK